MRQRLIQSHLSLVDLFLAPSRFLLERYIQWGIPREKIRFLENGRLPAAPFQEPTRNGARNRFGFFGQLLLYKGVLVLLEAMQLLESDSRRPFFKRFRRHGSRLDEYGQVANGADSPGAHLWIHGTGLEHQLPDFRDEFERHVRAIRSRVTFAGEYQPSDLPRLMANVDWVIVPSIWWENSPLVIQEAFQYGRPVICSGIGGMAEKVTHEVNGLQFRAGDPGELANAISRAMQTPGLWESLRNGIPDVCRIDDHAAELSKIYRGLLEHRVSRG